jgi:Flp pilus assembly protein TadD
VSRAVFLLLIGSVLYLAVEADRPSGWIGLLVLAAHVALFVWVLLSVTRRGWGRPRLPLRLSGAAVFFFGIGIWITGIPLPARKLLVYGHVMAGALLLGTVAWGWGSRRAGTRLQGWERAGGAGLLLALLLGYAAAEYRRSTWEPPRYQAAACYRFLTATTPAQSGEPLFPSALRLRGQSGESCLESGCHREMAAPSTGSHAAAGSGAAYRATLADFVRRRGAQAGNWCQGCHAPETLRAGVWGLGSGVWTGASAETPGRKDAGASGFLTPQSAIRNPQSGLHPFGCVSCHAARNTHALFGSAALEIGPGPAPAVARLEALSRPKAHAGASLLPAFHRSAEFCAACHRKNWNLPQNGYRWMPGPDEYRGWQSSRFSGAALFAPGERMASRSCVNCHNPHRRSPGPPSLAVSPLQLDLFLRRPALGPAAVELLGRAPAPPPGEAVFLDVVVRNVGIGHDFPTGMPDLHEAWLEVMVSDGQGRLALASGRDETGAGAHTYRLVAVDRQGRAIRHGELDEMASAAEWRRIPCGEADLARYRLVVPPGGLGPVSVRLLRRRRPDFSRWAGEPVQPAEVLASVRVHGARVWGLGSGVWGKPSVSGFLPPLPRGEGAGGRGPYSAIRNPQSAIPQRWRHYGTALRAVKAYTQAIQAMNRSLQGAPDDPETLLSLGRVYLDEGDLLAAREQFRRAAVNGAGDRALAWEGATLRHMGQPEAAAAQLEPLVRRNPRDLRLHFELGLTYMSQLRSEEAAREWEAMLDVDPTDVSAHYNLMFCQRRLNLLAEARREEAIYRLLAEEETPPARPHLGGGASLEDRPLHVHPLERVR